MSRKLMMAGSVLLVSLFSVSAYAVTTWYEEWIEWTPGAGQKAQVNCANGHYAFAIQNFDEGKNTVSNYIKCGQISDYVPPGTNVNHSSCQDIPVLWSPGAGYKQWANCPAGKYAVGFSIFDYGGRNEGINNMKCCALAGRSTVHGAYTNVGVTWNAGYGPKGYGQCNSTNALITGLRLRDYGGNNQAVSDARCTVVGL